MVLYKRYRHCINVVDGIDMALVTVTMGLGVSGYIDISCCWNGSWCLAGSLLRLIEKYVSWRLSFKTKYHDNI